MTEYSKRGYNMDRLSDIESEDTSGRNYSDTTQVLQYGSDSTANCGRSRPKECCCFSTKTALITIALTMLVCVIVVICLDATISVVEKNFEAISPASNREEYTFVMNGSESTDTMPVFDSIPNKWTKTPVHISLSHVEVNPAMLSQELQYNAVLKTMSLINVTMFGRMGIKNDVILPFIKAYTLELNQPIGPLELLRLKNRNCSVSDVNSAFKLESFQHKDCLRSLIFFRNGHMPLKWEIEKIHMLNATVRITLFGVHVFVIDPVENELTSSFNFTQDILGDMMLSNASKPYFELKKLNLRNSQLDLSILSNFSNQLTELRLYNVDFRKSSQPSSLSLSEFKSLTTFWLMGSNSFSTFSTTSIELSDLTPNILNLRLILASLDYKNPISFTLDSLCLVYLEIKNPEIINRFDQIFDAKRVLWHGKSAGKVTFSTCQLWINVMKMPSVEYVVFEVDTVYTDFFYTNSVSSSNDGCNSTMTSLLKNLNLDIDLTRSFIMKKDTASGTWTGRNYDETNLPEATRAHMESGFADDKFVNPEPFFKLRIQNKDI